MWPVRALFAVEYHDRPIFRKTDKHHFWNSRIAMFLKWNREDPPDEERNLVTTAWNARVIVIPLSTSLGLADRIGREALCKFIAKQ